MRFVIQRVTYSTLKIDGEVCGHTDKGLLVLCGIANDDTKEIADKMVRKLCNMRIFEDENGKTNLALSDVGGKLMIVSQFTLYADCRHGNRPGFTNAGKPEMASPLYDYVLAKAGEYVDDVQHGVFGADMKIELLNDGPFTIILDSDDLK